MKIYIENLTFEAIIGILDHERLIPQTIQIDCTIEYHYTHTFFINYADVAHLIEKTVIQNKYELIEEALTSLSKILKEAFPRIHNLTLRLRKPNILPNCTVGVQNHFIF